MDLSQLMDMAGNISNMADMQQFMDIFETTYWLTAIMLIISKPVMEGMEKEAKPVIRSLFLLLAVLSVVLFAIKQTPLSKYFYIFTFIAIVAYAIVKKYNLKVEAQE